MKLLSNSGEHVLLLTTKTREHGKTKRTKSWQYVQNKRITYVCNEADDGAGG